MKLSDSGICKCGGKYTASEWTTKTHRKGRTSCSACGRTELKTESIMVKLEHKYANA